MPGMDLFSPLHDDLVAHILGLLPLKQVGRAQLVCRRWRDLTTDYSFVRNLYSQRRTTAGFFFNYRSQVIVDYFPLDRDGEADAAGDGLAPGLSFIPGTVSANPGRESMQIYGSCGGLLLLVCWCPHGGTVYYVCNPLIKKAAPIPLPAACLTFFSLAFDPYKSPHYKVVALGNMYDVHVYFSQTRSWRMAIHSDHSAGLFRGLCPTRGVFWNGSIVWVVAHSLVRFVIEDEQVMKMPMPARKKDWICAYIGESGGHLQMIGYTKKEKLTACFDILELQENQSKWSVTYRVDLSRVKELYPDIEWPTWIADYLALSPIYVIRGSGKVGQLMLIFSVPDKIMSYNMDDQEILFVKEITQACRLEHFWYSFYSYNPTLCPV